MKRHFLIIKHGALGDVVRTSYFAGALRRKHGSELRLSWITSEASRSLLEHNPHLDDLWTSFEPARAHSFDRVFSLDDEPDVVAQATQLKAARISGAVLANGERTYSEDVSEWFDMGILSKFGKARADELKKQNTRGVAEIFKKIFEVSEVQPEFFVPAELKASAKARLEPGKGGVRIGINPYAGGRWPSKELRTPELKTLVNALLGPQSILGPGVRLVLFGSGNDRLRNLAMLEETGHAGVLVPDTDRSILELAALIGALDYLITSDSLAMHLAIAQGVKCIAFFSPTSAVEIDSFGLCRKIRSTAPDYCSYAKDADNRSITADRILEKLRDQPSEGIK